MCSPLATPSLPTPDSQSVQKALSRKSSEKGTSSKLTEIKEKLSKHLNLDQQTPNYVSSSSSSYKRTIPKSRTSTKPSTVKPTNSTEPTSLKAGEEDHQKLANHSYSNPKPAYNMIRTSMAKYKNKLRLKLCQAQV